VAKRLTKFTVTIEFEADLSAEVRENEDEVESAEEAVDFVTESMFVQLEGLQDDFGVPYKKAAIRVRRGKS